MSSDESPRPTRIELGRRSDAGGTRDGRRFDSEQARRYWEVHASERARVDFAVDPDGLGNVCQAGAPLWLNRHYARFQHAVFVELLSRIERPRSAARALDVGCGAARWCRVLDARGYEVTGIDLQDELIERNRRVLPQVHFETISIQQLAAGDPFDLVSSVTVIQHIPAYEQPGVVAKLRSLLAPGGAALLLENVADDDAYVFSRSPEGWCELFEASGFAVSVVRPYEYSPCLRAVTRAAIWARSGAGVAPDPSPDTHLKPVFGADPTAAQRAVLAVKGLLQRGGAAIDRAAEPLLVRRRPRLIGPSHCGFLLRAL